MSNANFPTTRWSIVDQLADGSPDHAKAALENLCDQYREPLLQFLLLSKMCIPDDVDDVIQEFLAYFVEKENFQRADPKRGRLRTFLVGSLKNFASNWKARASAVKRGGGTQAVPMDELPDLPDNLSTVEETFDRAWGITVMNAAVSRLEREYSDRGKESWWAEISEFLEGDDASESYDAIAQRLDVRPNRVALEVFRLRRRFREVIREEVGNTVGQQGDIEDELRYLARVLAESPVNQQAGSLS